MNFLDEIVSYYVVNKEINMTAPKLSGQVGHVATKIAVKYNHELAFKEWFNNGEGSQAKIILRGSKKELEKLIEIGWEFTIDEGRTEIPENSLTVVGLKPMKKSEVIEKFKLIKRLQLLQ